MGHFKAQDNLEDKIAVNITVYPDIYTFYFVVYISLFDWLFDIARPQLGYLGPFLHTFYYLKPPSIIKSTADYDTKFLHKCNLECAYKDGTLKEEKQSSEISRLYLNHASKKEKRRENSISS